MSSTNHQNLEPFSKRIIHHIKTKKPSKLSTVISFFYFGTIVFIVNSMKYFNYKKEKEEKDIRKMREGTFILNMILYYKNENPLLKDYPEPKDFDIERWCEIETKTFEKEKKTIFEKFKKIMKD